ncbi:MAG: winged helix-turn-helix domain-containing protein [Candidatus Promineifilaceae bacterium]
MPAPTENILLNQTDTAISFDIEPAYNAIQSLMLILRAEKLSGLGEWTTQTLAKMTAEEKHRHDLVMMGLHFATVPLQSWPSFPAYLDHLATADPETLRDKILDTYDMMPVWEEEASPITDRQVALSDVETFLTYLKQRFKPEHLDIATESEAYTYLVDPPALQKLVVSHLQHMWDSYLAVEWQRVEPMLRDAVTAFRQIDFSQMERMEAVEFITGQKPSEKHWERRLLEFEQLVFVPSTHIGPYLSIFPRGDAVRIVFGARLPEGADLHAPDLSRAEILVRLSALADDSRLSILKLIADEGEQRSQDIIKQLDMSQSAASRHLTQLSATGYLIERRCNGAKCYHLNTERLENTLRAVSAFLIG